MLRTLSFCLLIAIAVSPAVAQSDPAIFDTVYNIGNVEPGSIFDITDADIPGQLVTGTSVGDGGVFVTTPLTPTDLTGDILGSNSQLNLFNGGEILSGFNAGLGDSSDENIEVNITGGTVGDSFSARSGSTVNISGGSVDSGFVVVTRFNAFAGSTVNITGGNVRGSFGANTGSTVNISGGTVGNSGFDANTGSTVNIIGGSFELNGAAVSDLSAGFGLGSIGAPNIDLFTGILADGSVFIFSGLDNDDFAPGTTTLQSVAVAPSANPGVLSAGVFTQGVRAGETLTVTGTGELGENFAVVGGTLNIENGSVGSGLVVAFGEVNISGGNVRGSFNAAESFSAFAGSTVNISGGSVGINFDARSGSTVNISGGSVGDRFDARSGSTVNISGGNVGGGFRASNGSTVNISGGAFQLNRVAINDLSAGLTLPGSDITDLFTGVLADGSVFIFTLQDGDNLVAGTTTLQSVSVPPSANPGVLSAGVFTQGVRAGETLTVNGTGELGENFAVVGGTLNINGGSVGSGLQVGFGEVNISGGNVGGDFNAFDGVDALFGSTVNISGGNVGGGFDARSGSTVNISGGNVGSNFEAFSDSTVNISGGNVGSFFNAFSDSTVNLFGTEFFLDGVALTDLVLGEAFTITDRDVTLTGLLADGSPFEFDLQFFSGRDFFQAGATLTVTSVITGIPGDFNNDGVVDVADYTVWRDSLGDAVALLNETVTPGLVTIEDYQIWVENFGAQITPALPAVARVPEPSSLTVLFLCCRPFGLRRRRGGTGVG